MAIDVPAIRGTSWNLVDVFMRNSRGRRGAEVNGQSSAEMTWQVGFPR